MLSIQSTYSLNKFFNTFKYTFILTYLIIKKKHAIAIQVDKGLLNVWLFSPFL